MGTRGPSKTPTNILKARGSKRAGDRPAEPIAPEGDPVCPDWLRPEAKDYWARLMPMLQNQKLLAECDENAIARYCQTLAKWRQSEEFLMKHGESYGMVDATGNTIIKAYLQVNLSIKLSEVLLRLEREFGLTPSARASLGAVENPGINKDKAAKYFNHGRNKTA